MYVRKEKIFERSSKTLKKKYVALLENLSHIQNLNSYATTSRYSRRKDIGMFVVKI